MDGTRRTNVATSDGSSSAEFGVLVGVLATGVIAAAISLVGATADQVDASAECVAEVTSCADEG